MRRQLQCRWPWLFQQLCSDRGAAQSHRQVSVTSENMRVRPDCSTMQSSSWLEPVTKHRCATDAAPSNHRMMSTGLPRARTEPSFSSMPKTCIAQRSWFDLNDARQGLTSATNRVRRQDHKQTTALVICDVSIGIKLLAPQSLLGLVICHSVSQRGPFLHKD